MDCSLPSSSIHGISQQEYQSGLPFPTPVDLPDPRIESESPALVGRFFTTEPPGKSNSRLGRNYVLGVLGKGLVYGSGWGQLLIIASFYSQRCPGWVKNLWSPYLWVTNGILATPVTHGLGPYSSKSGPWITAQSTIVRLWGPSPDPWVRICIFNKTPEWYLCKIKSKKHYPGKIDWPDISLRTVRFCKLS